MSSRKRKTASARQVDTRQLHTSNFQPVWLVCLILILLTTAVFGRVYLYQFVYDDDQYIVDNTEIHHGLDADGVLWSLTATYAGNWHPVTWLSHMVDIQLFGPRPSGHHVTNLLFHIANVLLLFGLLRAMTGALWRSAFVAVLFAVHPLHVESVAWVAERKDVLSTFFWLLTMWAYMHYAAAPSIKRYLLVSCAFVLGLASKPMVVTLPLILLLLDRWPLGRFQTSEGPGHSGIYWSLVREKLPLFALSLASSIITFIAQQQGLAVGSLERLSVLLRVENALVSYVLYIGKMLWPTNLAVFYPHPGASLPVWKPVIAAILLAVISTGVLHASRTRPYLKFGWYWFLVTLLPVIGLVSVGAQGMADRYTYVPLIGLFVMIAWGVPDIILGFTAGEKPPLVDEALWSIGQRRLLGGIAAIIIMVLATRAYVQVGYWRNGITLFEHAAAVTTDNYLAYANLATYQSHAGLHPQSVENYQKAIKLKPNFAEAHINLAAALYLNGQYADAWKQIHLCRRKRYPLNPVVPELLSKKMPEPPE